jgi:hypothetical protein
MPAFSQARWFNRTEVTVMGKKENKKDKGQSDQKNRSRPIAVCEL